VPENYGSGNNHNQWTSLLTRPIPSPMVPEKINRIWTIGFNQVINLSSPLRNLLNS